MSPIGDGAAGVIAILAACALPTEIWRWAGVALGRNLNPNGDVLVWVRSVATAIIAAFVAKVIFFPAGGLADVPLWARLAAAGVGVAVYFVARRIVVAGVAASIAALMLLRAMLAG